ncbi:hypothetical protein, partial [Dawidia soli]
FFLSNRVQRSSNTPTCGDASLVIIPNTDIRRVKDRGEMKFWLRLSHAVFAIRTFMRRTAIGR